MPRTTFKGFKGSNLNWVIVIGGIGEKFLRVSGEYSGNFKRNDYLVATCCNFRKQNKEYGRLSCPILQSRFQFDTYISHNTETKITYYKNSAKNLQKIAKKFIFPLQTCFLCKSHTLRLQIFFAKMADFWAKTKNHGW